MVQALAKKFRSNAYSPGELAELRRLDFRQGFTSAGPAFWRVVTQELEPQGHVSEWAQEEVLRRWMVILQGLASLDELCAEKPSLGAALAQANVSEARVTRLLTARGDALLSQVRPLAHQLRSQAQQVNWAPMAQLLFSEGRRSGDEIRQKIARDFYRQQYRDGEQGDGDTA
ncbi:MAG: type I-E CRISPR-associated protein Cse2/CasB [Acidobacteriota bacterium]